MATKKKEKIEDLSGLSVTDLRKQAAKLSEDLFNLRIQNASGQLENTAQIRVARRQIARIKSTISQKMAAL